MSDFLKKITANTKTVTNEIRTIRQKWAQQTAKEENTFDIILSTLITQVTIVQALYKNIIIADCKLNRLPPSIVSHDALLNDLQALNSNLRTDDRKLAFNIKDYPRLYTLKLTQCTISENKILISIKIPIVHLHHNWNIFEYNTIPFQWHNQTCTLDSQKTIIAVSGNAIVEITGRNLLFCDPHHTGMCMLPRLAAATTMSNVSSCVKEMFSGRSTSELQKFCVFHCHPANGPIITQLSQERFTLTHMSGPVQTTCRLHKSLDFILPSTNNTGAIEVDLPCDCTLRQYDTVIIPE